MCGSPTGEPRCSLERPSARSSNSWARPRPRSGTRLQTTAASRPRGCERSGWSCTRRGSAARLPGAASQPGRSSSGRSAGPAWRAARAQLSRGPRRWRPLRREVRGPWVPLVHANPKSAFGYLISQLESVLGDLETPHHGLVVHRARLQDGHGTSEPGALMAVLQQDDVVREVRKAVLGHAPQLEQLRHLDDHHQADAAPIGALDERKHPLAKAHRVGGGRHDVGQAVDDDALGPGCFDQFEQLVDPLVNVHVDQGPTHDVDTFLVEGPAEAANDPSQLGLVLLERGQDARLPRACPGKDEVKPHQRLADAGRPRDQCGRAGPIPLAQHLIERREARRHTLRAELIWRAVQSVGQARENVEPGRSDAVCMLTTQKSAATQLQDLEHAELALRRFPVLQRYHAVGHRKLGRVLRLVPRVGRVPDRRDRAGLQAARESVQEQPAVALALGEGVRRLETVDHDYPGLELLEEPIDGPEHLVQAIVTEQNAKVLVHDAAVADGSRVEEFERLPIPKYLVERFGHSRHVERGALGRGVMKDVLLAQDRLAGARYADQEIDGIAQETAVQDAVETGLPAGKPFDHVRVSVRCTSLERALVPSRSRIVDTSTSGSSGLCRNAAAPARSASWAASIDATATTTTPALDANSPHSLKPAPPEIRRSSTTSSGNLSWKSRVAWRASRAMHTS